MRTIPRSLACALLSTSIEVTNMDKPADKTAYGWRPECARDQQSIDPYETWLTYQASSLMGRSATIEEARELFNWVDVHTREVIQDTPPRRWWHWFLEL